MVVSKQEKKLVKRWKKLGFDYFEIKELFSSIKETEKVLKNAIGVCKGQTEKLKEEDEKRKKVYNFLTSSETVK